MFVRCPIRRHALLKNVDGLMEECDLTAGEVMREHKIFVDPPAVWKLNERYQIRGCFDGLEEVLLEVCVDSLRPRMSMTSVFAVFDATDLPWTFVGVYQRLESQ